MAQFRKGESGNPAGKPKGATDKRNRYREMLQPHAPALLEKVVSLALGGDVQALRICIDRLIPALKPQAESINIDIPSGTLTEQAAAIFGQATTGELSLDEAATMTTMLFTQARISDVDALKTELEALRRSVRKVDSLLCKDDRRF